MIGKLYKGGTSVKMMTDVADNLQDVCQQSSLIEGDDVSYR